MEVLSPASPRRSASDRSLPPPRAACSSSADHSTATCASPTLQYIPSLQLAFLEIMDLPFPQLSAVGRTRGRVWG